MVARREWSARVLGPGGLAGPDGQRLRLERRAAALLAYLGLEGPSAKVSVSGLLWPDSPPATARNNLRQLLRRLRLLCAGEALVTATAEQLSLSPGVWLDVADLKAAAGARAPAQALAALPEEGCAPVLLAGLDFAEGDELSRWLTGARAAVEGWVRTARETRVEHHLGQGHWEPALALLQAWLRQEPESERAGRQLIRWHYLQGDRGAALAAFERLSAVLSRELGVSPMPETLALVRRIEQGTCAPPPPPARVLLPLSVQRPPRLLGRAEAWRQLEEGCKAGQLLFIRGEPGVGKSRLAEEFAASKGRWVRIEGRFADPGVPFASQARALRVHLARRPEVTLPGWVRAELSRILPELEPLPDAPPVDTAAPELRFHEAHAEAMRLLMDEDVVIVDDVQYWDAASARLFTYAFGRLLEAGAGHRPCFIDCYRRGELPAYSEHNVRQLVDAGVARVVDLEPLSPEDVRQLVVSLELPGAERHAEALAGYTGGYPLYILETLKHLLETEGLHKDWPHRLPPPGRVGPLLRRRLDRLSPLALQLAQLATLRDAPLPVALAAALLEVSLVEVQAALAELDAAQVLVGERFSHDLVEEAVRATLAPAVAQVLKQRLTARS